jgi:hypothetical protein
MKVERFIQLTQVAADVMAMLTDKGVTRQERCTVDRICNNINEATYDQDGDGCQAQPTVSLGC